MDGVWGDYGGWGAGFVASRAVDVDGVHAAWERLGGDVGDAAAHPWPRITCYRC